jgi:nanoRNase/pAp phosphatase (c-di-AMP/oligoRNAs hydrolase)
MALTEIKQATSLIERAGDVLLIVPEKASTDALASLIALYLALADRTGRTDTALEAVSPGHLPRTLQFLAGSSQVKVAPTEHPEVILDMALPTPIEHIRPEPLSGGTRLHIALPPGAVITKDQLETSVRLLPYDAAVIIGALDLEELGQLFTRHTDFFYNTPMINLDHRAANEHFGTINLVDITAGSSAEVAYDLIENLSPGRLTPDIATALYAGIVAGTDSFQRPSTTPRSFQAAARLIEADADREAVIQHLVKTKPLRIIKLTGAIYARLRFEESVGLYWTILEPNDFQESGANSNDVPQAMHELTSNIAGFTAAFLLYETRPAAPTDSHRRYVVYLLLGKGLASRRREIQEVLAASQQNGALTFAITAPSIEAAEQHAHNQIRQILP